MFFVALLYRGVIIVKPVGDETRREVIVRTIKSEYKYFPCTYLYVFPVFLVSFYLIPVRYMPLFMATVDFLSDILGSWFLFRNAKKREQERKEGWRPLSRDALEGKGPQRRPQER